MQYISIQKHARVTPQKAREVVSMIKKMTPLQAVEALPFSQKSGVELVVKTIKSAIENAKQKGVDEKDLVFSEIQINEGSRLKRGIAVSKGRWHPILKRMCHIRVVLKTKEVRKIIKEELKKKSITTEGKVAATSKTHKETYKAPKSAAKKEVKRSNK